MPHTTAAFGFEWKVLASLSGRDIPPSALFEPAPERPRAWVRTPDGWQREYPPEDDLARLREGFALSGASYILHDPFDPPEYEWLEWHAVDRSSMERFIGAAFEGSEFRSANRRTMAFPADWGVMF